MNHSTLNTTLRMTVEMAYAYWESDDIKMKSNTNTSEKPKQVAKAPI